MSRNSYFRPTLACIALLAVIGLTAAAHAADAPDKWAGDPYPLATDPVTGEALPAYDKQVIIQHDGRELRFASQANADTFNAHPEKYLPAVDAQIIKEQTPWYPLTACPVSGEKLGGDMGEAVDMVYKNRLIRFCCPSCKKDFLADPAKYIAKIDEAIVAQQQPKYPFTQCMVSGEKLGEMGKPIQRIVANHLVEFCCPMCVKKFNQDPAKYLKQIDDAKAKESH